MRPPAIFLILLLLKTLSGQQTAAPTPEPVGPAEGQDLGSYNIVSSFETGYRFHTVDGDTGKYRSDVNYGNGIRLLGSKLTVNSKNGQGRWFDEIVLTTQGLGNDPYQFSSLRVGKNRVYRYDMLWRLSDYFNPGLTIAGGEHLLNTQRRLQDHDLTLFPQSKIKWFLGYTRNKQDGPALTTIQFPNALGDVFPLFSNVRRERNEYRLGGEVSLFGLKLNWLRGWDNYKEDTPVFLTGPSAGNNPNDLSVLSSFQRNEPYHGNAPFWRVNLFTESRKKIAFNGRFSYSIARRNFVFDETADGTGGFGSPLDRQTMVFGTGRRPVLAGNVTVSVFPVDKLTIANQTAVNDVRIDGDSSFLEFNNSLARPTVLFFRFLGLRTIVNTTDATYRVSRWLGLYGGYHYSTRRVRSVEQEEIAGNLDRRPAEQENHLHSGLAGVRLQVWKPLTLSLDGEAGRADRPFFPIGEKNYHALNARLRFKAKSLTLSAAARSNYNVNSVSLSSHSSRARNYSFDASWAPSGWFAFDAGYSKLHLDTASGIAYFASGDFVQGDRSIYVSNIHAGNLGMRLAMGKAADLYLGYSHVQDAGDGRAAPEIGSGAGLSAFLAAQTFPVTFRTPLARLSIRIHENLRWNFGYQYYGYREEFFDRRNYRAHTGYSSLLWSF